MDRHMRESLDHWLTTDPRDQAEPDEPDQAPLIAIIHWPADPDRGQEVIGPFGSDDERTAWVAEVTAAGDGGDPLLTGVHFVLTRLDPPFEVQR
jgi:hypothetical protein